MSLPETSSADLYVMGITPDMIKAEIEKTQGKIDGKVVGFYLPGDGEYNGNVIYRARNYLKSDWVDVEHRPSTIVTQNTYDQRFENFDDDKPKQFQFTNSVSLTTGTDFSQTRSFDVNVNASIPLGQSGAMVGFSATMSASDVASKSESKTISKSVSFTVDVPGGEGRKVTETTTESSTDTVWQAQIGVRGTVGIEIDPGWWTPNYHWWYYNIESVFPNATANSRILRSGIDTTVDTKTTKLPKPNSNSNNNNTIKGSDGKAILDPDEILEFRQHDDTRSETLTTPTQQNIGVGVSEARFWKPLASQTDRVRINFDHQGQPVPVGTRAAKVATWKSKILIGVTPHGAINGFLGPTQWSPNPQVANAASFTIPYLDQKITRPELRAEVIGFARTVVWGGGFVITFG